MLLKTIATGAFVSVVAVAQAEQTISFECSSSLQLVDSVVDYTFEGDILLDERGSLTTVEQDDPLAFNKIALYSNGLKLTKTVTDSNGESVTKTSRLAPSEFYYRKAQKTVVIRARPGDAEVTGIWLPAPYLVFSVNSSISTAVNTQYFNILTNYEDPNVAETNNKNLTTPSSTSACTFSL